MNLIIEIAKPSDAEDLLAYLKKVGSESDNLRAVRLYEKFGFKKIGVHPSYTKIDGVDIPADYMCLKL